MKTSIQAAAAVTLFASQAAHAQGAVQWRVQDGGNGHWYQIVQRTYGTYDWTQTRAACIAIGGDLASFETSAEWAFMRSRCRELPPGPVNSGQLLAGGRRSAGASSQWTWLTGQTFSYFAWNSGAPNDGTGQELVLCVGSGIGSVSAFDGWDDWRVVDLSSGYVIEWSADCNEDGIVDFGQILDGTFPDSNGNGVPDCCDGGGSCCVGDILADRVINGADLGALLAYWGPVTTSPISRACDLNGDNVVNGADIGLLLSGWGNCP